MEKYRAEAVNCNGKVLYTSYIEASPEMAEKSGKSALSLFVSGKFTVRISPMFDERD